MKHYRFAIIWILWFYAGPVSAQWIYSQGFASVTGTPELQRVNLADHTFVRLVGMGDMGDIAFHPDQRLFGVIFDKVYLIDTITSAYTEIYDIGDFQSVGMTIDYMGNMYFSGSNPNTNRFGIVIYNPVTSMTRIVADFGPINQGFINDLEFYNGRLYVVGELPSNFSERAVLFGVDTSGLNQHDTIVQYDMWPGRALAAINDTCGSQYLVSPTTSLLNYFFPPFDSIDAFSLLLSDGLFYSSGAASRTSHLGSIPGLKITGIDIFQDPCTGNSNASVTVYIQPGRPSSIQYSIDGTNYQDSNLFTNVMPGRYQILIRDSWGCEEMGSFEILDMDAFPLTINVTPATCGVNNGTIIIHSSVDGLYYALDDLIFVEDSIFANLAGGSYRLIIRDAAGCADTIELKVDSFAAPSFDVSLEAEQCHAENGEIEFINVEGEGPMQFSLDGITWQGDHIFSQLSSGPYIIFIRDVFNCTVQENVFLEETGQPDIEDIVVSAEECGESNGHLEVTADSDHGPIQYSLNGGAFSIMPYFNHLVAGTYTVSLVDTLGCIIELMIEVPGNGGPVIHDTQITAEYCEKSNGRIVILASSDQGPLQFAIDNGPYTNSPEFIDLKEGYYLVMIRDTNGCQLQTEIIVEGIQGIEIDSIISVDASCGMENGTIHIISETASANVYSLDRQLYQSEPHFTDLASGIYTAYLISYEECVDSALVTIEGHKGPVIDDLLLIQPTCKEDQGMVFISGHGESELRFELDHEFSNTNGQFTGLTAGPHEVIISDHLGCMVDTTFNIIPGKCSFYIPNVFSPNGDGVNDLFSFVTEEDLVRIDHFEIYDRWGNKVFACIVEAGCEWDGKINDQPAPVGVYLYQLSFTERNDSQYITGEVTLLR